MKSRQGRDIFAFRGIPYAMAPVGELRFEPPKPPASWSGVLSAKEDPQLCPQRNIFVHQEEIVGTEDCLYLNVYSPRLPGDDKNAESYPVMIWFHGGGWVTGAGRSDFYGPKHFLDHDVVLVGVNYRLGPLGFLSTEDMISPGNQGMKDQAQSIRWVHENIRSFGGDPNRVTIFGESAGGASVHYHMISELSKGLFHRGISESGNVYCPWTLTPPGLARKNAMKLGKLVGCPTGDSKSLIECLRKKDPADIIGTDRAYQEFGYCPLIPFRPVIEPDHPGAFIKEHPITSSKKGRIADIPWMTGIVAHEGSLKVPSLYMDDAKLLKELNDNFLKIGPITLLYGETCPEHLRDEITLKIRDFYLANKTLDESSRFPLIDMYSDAWFMAAADASAKDYFANLASPLFYYYLAYKGTASFSQIFGDPKADYGVCHADELQYLFPVRDQLFPDIPMSSEDRKISEILTKLWLNFAKTGNPNVDAKAIPVKWMPVRTTSLEYLHIGNSKDIRMSRHLHADRMKFWSTLPIRSEEQRPVQHLREEL